MKQWCLLIAMVWGSCEMYFSQLQAIVPATTNPLITPEQGLLPSLGAPGIPGLTPGQELDMSGMQPDASNTEQQALPAADAMAVTDVASIPQPVASDQPLGGMTPIPQPNQDVPGTDQTTPDTVELPDKEIGIQGNWMKKKEWLKRAYEVYDQVQKLGVEVQTSRSTYNQKFNSIDDELDQFYKNYGVQQGKLDELFTSVAAFLEKKKQRELAELAAQRQQDKIVERDYKTRIEEMEAVVRTHKTQLDQLRFNMKSIEELDRSISERLTRLDQQIESALQLINQGNTIVSSMWHIIDDTIARTKYYELVNNVQAPMQAIQAYLTTDLQNDFDQVIGTIRQQIAKVLDDTRQLEAAGLVLKNRSPRLEEIRTQVKLEREKALKAEQEAEKKRQEELARKKQTKKIIQLPWWKRIYIFVYVLFSQLLSLITGSEPTTPVQKNSPPSTQASSA